MGRILVLLLLAAPAIAHPLPVLRFDRTVEVKLTAAGVYVRYTLELNEWSMVLDKELPAEKNLQADRKQFAIEYAKKKGAILADRMIASLGNQQLAFRLETAPEIHPNADHLEFRFRFVADWPAGVRGKPEPFQFEDTNFESQPGRLLLTAKSESGIAVNDLIDPGDLRGVAPIDLKPGDEVKLRRISATIELPAKASAIPQAVGPAEPVVAGERPGLFEGLFQRGLTALFDSDAGIGLLLFAAVLFGMAHAFTPGHGKTLVAAYLVGEKGTIRHAWVLGLTTTLAHTGSVIGVAIVLWAVYREGVPQEAQGWLQLAGGLLIAIVGLWLFLQRFRGRADHVHLFNDHHHPDEKKSFGWGRVLLLGLGGGLIPCWDAVMLLLVAIAAGRLGFAIPMLLAFSVGLAAVLVGLGIGVVLAHRAGAGRFGERRWFQALPVLSAGLLVLMGLWLAREGAQLLSAAAKG